MSAIKIRIEISEINIPDGIMTDVFKSFTTDVRFLVISAEFFWR
jgi:hypothetical protein